jgi:hypothetical protein
MDEIVIPPCLYDWDFDVDDFLSRLEDYPTELTVEIPDETVSMSMEPVVYNVVSPSTPKRKTFGAQMNELRTEIAILREEIAYRDAQLLDMYYLLYNKIKS